MKLNFLKIFLINHHVYNKKASILASSSEVIFFSHT